MVLKNHIAYRFLTDDSIAMELVETMHPKECLEFADKNKIDDASLSKIASLYYFVSKEDQKAYYITESVLDKLDMLHVSKRKYGGSEEERYDWTFFKNVKPRKLTFIFPDNSLLRMVVDDTHLHFCHTRFKFNNGSRDNGHMSWTLFYVNRVTGEQCEHFAHNDVKQIEEFVYKLLCFFYLSENEEIVLSPNQKYGTRKTGKFINEFQKINVTIVNSKWNVTSIRTEGFGVKGHFALRWTGEGRLIPKMVLIEPFEKNGYVRRAQNEIENI